MKKALLIAAGLAVFSTPALASDDALKSALSGKTLITEGVTIKLARNGAMSGKTPRADLKGAWTVRDGKFCRTIKSPEPLAGTECQAAALDGKVLTLQTGRGPVVYQIK